jgi:hypothetical protein
MKITIPTSTGAALEKKIFKAVEDETLKTWEVRSGEVKYLTHKPEQWYDKVLLRFTVTKEALEVDTYWWKGNVPNEDVKGYYIGRFTEALLVHFRGDFETFTISK